MVKKSKVIAKPPPDVLLKKFRPYAVELGHLVYSWNLLQEALSRIFWQISGIPDIRQALAIWYSVPSDRTQRDILRAALNLCPPTKLAKFPKAKDDLKWMLDRVNDLAVRRNDAVHSPFSFEATGRGVKLKSFHIFGHPRAMRLKDKDLRNEFIWYTDSAYTLSRFAYDAARCLGSVPGVTWPDRPAMPHRDQYLTRKSPPRKRGKLPPPPPSPFQG